MNTQDFLKNARRKARERLFGSTSSEIHDENRDLDYMVGVVNGLLAINNEIWGRCKEFRFDHQFLPNSKELSVTGAGVREVNGVYRCTGKVEEEDEYTKSGNWEGKEVTFSLYRYRAVFYISILSEHKEPGSHDDKDFYRTSPNRPISGPWRTIYLASRNNAVDPPPVVKKRMSCVGVGLRSDDLLILPAGKPESGESNSSEASIEPTVRMSRISFENTRVKGNEKERETQSLNITLQASLSCKDFGTPPCLPDALTKIVQKAPRSKEEKKKIFIDYEEYIQRASLLRDDVLMSFLKTLQTHLEDVHCFLGKIEEWLAEQHTTLTFLNDLFGKNLKVVHVGHAFKKNYAAVERNGTCTMFKGEKSPGAMELSFDINNKKSRDDLKSFFRFVQTFNKASGYDP